MEELENNQIIEPSYKQIECQEQDVIDFQDNTYKVSRLQNAIIEYFDDATAENIDSYINESHNIDVSVTSPLDWFEDGIDCEILQIGSQKWKKGKVKIKVSLAFYVEEEEAENQVIDQDINDSHSPLDDIRRQINQVV